VVCVRRHRRRSEKDRPDGDGHYDVLEVETRSFNRPCFDEPWTVTKHYRREPSRYPVWREVVGSESNQHVRIGNDDYFLSAEGYLMPAKKVQSPPDLRYFDQSRK
jgi:hypothetical protein